MYPTGTNIGEYLDPAMIDSAVLNGVVDPIRPSEEGVIQGLVDVPLADGRVAIMDGNGIIVGYR